MRKKFRNEGFGSGVEVTMYSGHMLEELVDMVARAETHAREQHSVEAEERPQPFYASSFILEGSNHRALIGVA